MTTRNNITENPEHIDDKLKALTGKNEPFKVPDGYFDELPVRMLGAYRKNRDLRRPFLHFIPPVVRYAAAASILILAIWGSSVLFFNGQDETHDVAEFTAEEVYRYNLTHLAQLEEEYLLLLTEAPYTETFYSTDIEETGITNEEIIDYLLSENHIEYHTITGY